MAHRTKGNDYGGWIAKPSSEMSLFGGAKHKKKRDDTDIIDREITLQLQVIEPVG